MPEAPRKAAYACPECGHVQQESTYLISTYCRACGSYYEVRNASRDKRPVAAPQRQAPRVLRSVRCHKCGETHEVSSHSQSTICPGCNASIEFADVVISSNTSRPVDTRGKLIVEEAGNLNSNLIICSEAAVWGKMSGVLQCEGTVRLHSKGKLSCRITAKTVIIESDADIEFTHAVESGTLEVFGRAIGRFECAGAVKVKKGGTLEGRFRSRSIVVDGGSLLAESSVESVLPETEQKK